MKDRVTFLTDEDQELYKSLLAPSFEVQVGLHELLGHGSGKLFAEGEAVPGGFPEGFTMGSYQAGQTWDTVFSSMASTYEECRAESTGLHLCLFPDILEVLLRRIP